MSKLIQRYVSLCRLVCSSVCIYNYVCVQLHCFAADLLNLVLRKGSLVWYWQQVKPDIIRMFLRMYLWMYF